MVRAAGAENSSSPVTLPRAFLLKLGKKVADAVEKRQKWDLFTNKMGVVLCVLLFFIPMIIIYEDNIAKKTYGEEDIMFVMV